MKILIDREEIERAISCLTIPDTIFAGNASAKRVLQKILDEHPFRTDSKGLPLDEGSSILIYPPVIDVIADVVDILSAYWWNSHTKESENAARLLEPILLQLEEMRSENIS